MFMRFFDDLSQKGIECEPPISKVLGIGGSPRKGGNSDVLLKHMLQGVTENKITAESLNLRDFHYQGCIGCEKCRRDKNLYRIKRRNVSDLSGHTGISGIDTRIAHSPLQCYGMDESLHRPSILFLYV